MNKKMIVNSFLSLLMGVLLVFVFMTPVSATDMNALDNNIYNLVTSFIGDASTSRGFAWTAVDGNADMVLRYKKAEETEYMVITPTVVDKGSHLYYKADVKNLTPGTLYTYQIGNLNTDLWYGPFEFTTYLEKVDSFTFIGVSDPQASTENGFSYFKSNIKAAITDNPDTSFIVNLGDLVNNGYNEEQWKWHFEALEGYIENIPYMCVVGNHDAYNPTDMDPSYDDMWDALENFSLHFNNPDNGAIAMKTVSSEDMETQWFQDITEHLEDTFYSFDYGNAHFAVLNTTAEVSMGSEYAKDYRKIMQVQREWLQSDLENSGAKWKIVLLHMGGYRADLWRNDICSIEYFGDIIDDNGVDLVLEGHDHIYMRSYPIFNGDVEKISCKEIDSSLFGTTYSVLGAAAKKRYTASQLKGPGEHVHKYVNTEENQPVYCVFRVSDEKIEIIAKQLDGTVLDEYSIVKSNQSNLEGGIVNADTDMVTVKGITVDGAMVTILVTYPNVEKITSPDDIVYLSELKTNGKGAYYFNFGDRKKNIGKYKIIMNVDGARSEFDYMYSPKMYVLEGDMQIDKLSDISSNVFEVKMEVINTDNGRILCAQYKDSKIVDVSFADVTTGVKGGMSVSYYGSSHVDEIKLFFWDKTSLKPMLKPIVIK